MERAAPFKFQSPSSILIAEPLGCGKTCFTESFLVHHLSDLFAQSPTAIVYCYGAWQEKFDRMRHNGYKISQRSPRCITSTKMIYSERRYFGFE